MNATSTPVDFANVTSVADGAGAVTEAASDYNGFHVDVDLGKLVDYTDDVAKICTSRPVERNPPQFNLRDTLIYRLWVIQGKPTVATPMTQDQLNRLAEWGRMDIARAGIYALCHAAGHTVSFRNSDVVSIDIVPEEVRLGRTVDVVVGYLKDRPDQAAALATAGRNCLMCIEANAIHREQLDGHNWYTRDTMISRTPTGKACSIAGADIAPFREFMREFGHDTFHHLTDESLNFIALHVAGNGRATVATRNYQYAGRDVHGERLSILFYTGESAVNRYPAGILGKASVIVGCAMTTAMIHNISTVARLTGSSGISRIVESVRAKVADASLSHQTLLDIGKKMEPVMALTYGYCCSARLMDEDDYLSFRNHAERSPGGVATGRSLAVAVMNARPHNQAVTGAILAGLSQIGDIFYGVAQLQVSEGGRMVNFLPRIHGPVYDPNVLSAEVGVDPSGQLMDALLSGRMGGGAAGDGGNTGTGAQAAAITAAAGAPPIARINIPAADDATEDGDDVTT